MTPRRYLAWVRLLCAVALGLGVSGAAAAIAASPDALHARPAIAQLRGALHEVTTASTRAPLAVSHHGGRHIPPSIGSALLATAALVGSLGLATRRRVSSTTGEGRHTNAAGARAPPVAIGI
jgi:hypothetical protein